MPKKWSVTQKTRLKGSKRKSVAKASEKRSSYPDFILSEGVVVDGNLITTLGFSELRSRRLSLPGLCLGHLDLVVLPVTIGALNCER